MNRSGVSIGAVRSGVRGALGRSGEWVVVGLGSNLGDSRRVLGMALTRLQDFAGQPLLRSSLWWSAPVDCPPGSPEFINAVAAWARQPGQEPEPLLENLQEVEREFGRRPKQAVNEPRPLDLDLIAFGRETRRSDQLTLPHPRAVERAFVLCPLSEVLPDLILPGQDRSVRALRDALGCMGVRRIEVVWLDAGAVKPIGRVVPRNQRSRRGASRRVGLDL